LEATYGGSARKVQQPTGEAAVAAADAEDGPPSRWAVYETEDGIPYFYDKLTDTTTWEKPACLAAREVGGGAEKPTGGGAAREEVAAEVDPDGLEGRNGWTSYTDEEGYVYYHNGKSGATQWDKPVNF
jgi:hypothetical protein